MVYLPAGDYRFGWHVCKVCKVCIWFPIWNINVGPYLRANAFAPFADSTPTVGDPQTEVQKFVQIFGQETYDERFRFRG